MRLWLTRVLHTVFYVQMASSRAPSIRRNRSNSWSPYTIRAQQQSLSQIQRAEMPPPRRTSVSKVEELWPDERIAPAVWPGYTYGEKRSPSREVIEAMLRWTTDALEETSLSEKRRRSSASPSMDLSPKSNLKENLSPNRLTAMQKAG
jgi:hypothetical protein